MDNMFSVHNIAMMSNLEELHNSCRQKCVCIEEINFRMWKKETLHLTYSLLCFGRNSLLYWQSGKQDPCCVILVHSRSIHFLIIERHFQWIDSQYAQSVLHYRIYHFFWHKFCETCLHLTSRKNGCPLYFLQLLQVLLTTCICNFMYVCRPIKLS